MKDWHHFMLMMRLRSSLTDEKKRKLTMMLLGALKNDRQKRIKDAIDKFRQAYRLTDIQRRFLARLMNSKIGKVFNAFNQIRALPEMKDRKKGPIFYLRLQDFVLKNARATFNRFKYDGTEGSLRKRKAALLMIKNSISSNKKSIDKWHNYAMTAKMYERSRRVDEVMGILNKIEARNLASVYFRRQFNFKDIAHLHKQFVNFAELTAENLKYTFQTWRENAANQRVNPWFKKAAMILALNSTINRQKSLWRMKENMNDEGFQFSTPKVVKIKKMFNNIRKYYRLALAKSFWIIERVGKLNQSDSIDPRRMQSMISGDMSGDRSYHMVSTSVHQKQEVHHTSIVKDVEMQTKLEGLVHLNKRISVNIMNKIFKGKLSKWVRKWAFFTLPSRRLEFAYKEMDKSTPVYNSKFVARVGAADHLANLSNHIRFKSKALAFKKLTEHMYHDQIDKEHDSNFNDKLELLNRNSTLMA